MVCQTFQVVTQATPAWYLEILPYAPHQSPQPACVGIPPPPCSPLLLTSPVRSNGSQLHSQWVASLPVMLHRVVVAPTAIEVAPAAEDGSVGHVEPQVLPHVTLAALPAAVEKKGRRGAVRVKTFGFYCPRPLRHYPVAIAQAKVSVLSVLLLQDIGHPDMP